MAARSHLARPPYVDPNTNIIYDTDHAEFEGWLTKQSMWLKVRWVESSQTFFKPQQSGKKRLSDPNIESLEILIEVSDSFYYSTINSHLIFGFVDYRIGVEDTFC